MLASLSVSFNLSRRGTKPHLHIHSLQSVSPLCAPSTCFPFWGFNILSARQSLRVNGDFCHTLPLVSFRTQCTPSFLFFFHLQSCRLTLNCCLASICYISSYLLFFFFFLPWFLGFPFPSFLCFSLARSLWHWQSNLNSFCLTHHHHLGVAQQSRQFSNNSTSCGFICTTRSSKSFHVWSPELWISHFEHEEPQNESWGCLNTHGGNCLPPSSSFFFFLFTKRKWCKNQLQSWVWRKDQKSINS